MLTVPLADLVAAAKMRSKRLRAALKTTHVGPSRPGATERPKREARATRGDLVALSLEASK